jgi:Carboxypeptidase regulatory-like domain/TonB dependent receptor-like, beta-barrel
MLGFRKKSATSKLFLRWFLVFISTASLLALRIAAAVAQTSQGSIRGQVTDSRGAVVASATVTVVNNATGITDTTHTNGSGEYSVVDLNPGSYTVKMSSTGFKDLMTNSVTVSAGATAEVNGSLEVGQTTQTVMVQADTELLSTTSDVSTTVDRQIVENLPYPGRSSLEAVLLVPGVSGDTLSVGGISPENPGTTTQYFSPGASVSIGGTPPGMSAIIVDGSDVTEASYPRAGLNLSGQMVQETTVITAGASAEYGRTGGGVIVQATRAGTSEYHGAVTYRHTDPWFNAFPLGTTAKNDQHETYFGGYLGGPIRIPKLFHGNTKTFFYVGYEPARMRIDTNYRGLFLTPAELQGELHDSLDILNQTILKTQGYAAALAAPRVGGVGFDAPVGGNSNYPLFPYGQLYTSNSQYVEATGPMSDCTSAGITQQDLPGATACYDDLAPLLKANSFAQWVVSQMPTPTKPGPYVTFDSPDGAATTALTNGTYGRGVINTDNRWSVRIDHQFSNSDSIYGRYTEVPLNAARFFTVSQTNPLTQTPTDVEMGRDVAVGWTHIVTNNLVNTARYSWFREHLQRLPPSGAQSVDIAAKYGLTPAVVGYGMPNLGNFNSNGDSYSLQPGNLSGSIQVDQNFIMGDDVSWTHGPHAIMFGFDYRWIQSNQYDLSGVFGGKYSFSSSQSQAPNGQSTGAVIGGGSAWGSFLEGILSGSFSDTPVEVPAYYRYKYWGAYFQDNWRVTSKLTLNLGLRYEVQVPREEAKNNQAYISAKSIPGTLNGIPATVAFCFSGACGLQRSLWPTNYWGYEPRVGFAYAATPKTTVRASFAVSRQPLSGQENIPDPDFNVNGSSAGVASTYQQDYLTNPPSPASLVSSYTQLNGGRGPFYFSTGLSPVWVDQTNAVPYSEIWNLSVQDQPFSKTLVQATYQGVNGVHLYEQFPLAVNVPTLSAIQTAINNGTYLGATYPNAYGILANNNTSGSVSTESNFQMLEPYQNFFNQTIGRIYPRIGISHYNALYLSVNQRATRNVTLLAYYTWSKSLDDVPDVNAGAQAGYSTTSVQNPFDLKSEYAVSSFDQDSAFKAGYNVNLPFGIGQEFKTSNGLIDRVIGDWSFAGITTWVVGFPNTVTLGGSGNFYQVVPAGSPGCTAKAGTYCDTGVLPSGYTLRPNIVRGIPLINPGWKKNVYARTGTSTYLNTTISSSTPNLIGPFEMPGSVNAPALGNCPRTLPGARSPREFLMDMHIRKGVTFRENRQLNLTGDFFNVFNHPVYYGIGTHTPWSSTSINTTTGQATYNSNAAFGEMNNQSGGLSRVIRVGAAFVF